MKAHDSLSLDVGFAKHGFEMRQAGVRDIGGNLKSEKPLRKPSQSVSQSPWPIKMHFLVFRSYRFLLAFFTREKASDADEEDEEDNFEDEEDEEDEIEDEEDEENKFEDAVEEAE